MRLHINGEERELVAATLADVLRELGIDPAVPGVAVAQNGAVVPRARLQVAAVAEGDRIEVVRAVQGG